MSGLESNKSYQKMAEKIIKQLKDGTAPFVKSWEVAPSAPFNPVSGTQYKGINALSLHCEGRSDPRWMTYKQASSKDMQVRKGEKGSPIVYWQFNKESVKRDSSGKPVKDSKGKPVKEIVKLARPRVFGSTVFNAEQIDGIPPLEQPKRLDKFEVIERAEGILKESGADISYGGDRAFYSPVSDRIQLPEREAFKSEGDFYAVALHEVAHWTGHDSRLDRDLTGAFGSEKYAEEELRAEVASYMLSSELEIPFDPSQHVAYIESWIKKLDDDPAEIYKASKDADEIKTYTLGFDRTLDQKQDKEQEVKQEQKPEVTQELNHGLNQESKPVAEAEMKNETVGVYTDKTEKEPAVVRDINIVGDLKKACSEAGLVMNKDPVMDGKFHRVPVERPDGKANKDGSYKAFTDGRPAGIIINHYSGEKVKWKASGDKPLTLTERKAIAKQSHENKVKREALTERQHQHKAKRVKQLLSVMPKATDDNQYLKHKGVTASENVHQDKKGLLVVPITNVKGEAQSLVRINGTGKFKSYMKGAKKAGGMHMIGKPKAGDDILVAEGYSTGKTLNEATGKPVAVAFDANNVSSVALAVQQAYTTATVFVVGDDDRENDRNIGRTKATEAANAVKSQAIFPSFPAGSKGSDFNDLAAQLQKQGASKAAANQAVKAQIETGIRKGKGAEKHQARQKQAKFEKTTGVGNRGRSTARKADAKQENSVARSR